MIKDDARVLVEYGQDGQVICVWEGGRYALASTRLVREFHKRNSRPLETFSVGGLRLRLIEKQLISYSTWDNWVIAKADDPIAYLNSVWRRCIQWALVLLAKYESMNLTAKEGERAKVAGWIADKLL